MESETKQVIGIGLLAVFLLFFMVLLPQSVGLSRGGFDNTEVLQQYYFYVGSGVSFLLGILILFVVELYITRKESQYGGNSLSFSSQGDMPSIPFFKNISTIQLTWLSIIVFSAFSLWLSLTSQTSFTGIRFLENQFTKIDSAIFSGGLIPAAENLGLAFVIALSIFGTRYIARKYNITSESFMGIAWFGILLGGVYGVLNHMMRYGGSDISLITVFIFWALGALMTLASGSFIPFWIYHICNNLFFDLKRYYSSETMLIYVGTVVFALAALYYIVYRNRLFSKPRGTSNYG